MFIIIYLVSESEYQIIQNIISAAIFIFSLTGNFIIDTVECFLKVFMKIYVNPVNQRLQNHAKQSI